METRNIFDMVGPMLGYPGVPINEKKEKKCQKHKKAPSTHISKSCTRTLERRIYFCKRCALCSWVGCRSFLEELVIYIYSDFDELVGPINDEPGEHLARKPLRRPAQIARSVQLVSWFATVSVDKISWKGQDCENFMAETAHLTTYSR